MARKRLGPARGFGPEAEIPSSGPAEAAAAPEAKAMFPLGVARHAPAGVRPALSAPPIAQVSAHAAAHAAAETLAEDLRSARAGGRMVVALPLEDVDAGWLVRDRMAADPEELEALKISLRDRGQQTPIEVVDLGPGAQPRHGLVSGWRRLTALRALAQEDTRFSTVQALLRRPETTADAYRAMVEENEIRVGLSYYERARIVAEAADRGVYPDRAAALSGLFAAASRAKRSKIGSFVRIHDLLGDRLGFATALSERLGLQLARALEDDGFAALLRERLRKGAHATAEDELALLERALATPEHAARGGGAVAPEPGGSGSRPGNGAETGAKRSVPADPPAMAAGDIRVRRAEDGSLHLSGPGVTPAFETALRAWLIPNAR